MAKLVHGLDGEMQCLPGIVATYFTAPIGVVSVEFDLIVPRGDGSFHSKGRN